MQVIQQTFQVQYSYGIHFTEGLFNTNNTLLPDLLKKDGSLGPRKLLFVLDSGVAAAHPTLQQDIKAFSEHYSQVLTAASDFIIIPGGEEAKNDPKYLQQILDAVNDHGICRHSYLVAIGGGAILDLAGFAAAISHRGIRHIRIPTTVLSQNDSGVGVKNSVNAFQKKNFLGTFAPPFAVLNDYHFLTTLEDRDWRSGISEAIKVALIKDAAFYDEIKTNAAKLVARDKAAMDSLIFRCAELHVAHIGGKDPFEMGSSRPLDFGHWAAHKLEQLTNYELRHGEAVAIGIALDVTYSMLSGRLSEQDWENVLALLVELGFDLYVPELSQTISETNQTLCISVGLREFREHLGGQLTIMLLNKIGEGEEVHQMDDAMVKKAVALLAQRYSKAPVIH
ncbi:3-dehydroquinate synthase [Pontibacter arcticus]|uniref:3-dehydroquinate synthase n=1 Tax=Pontibacter arcticus TaxID=2080288 RepID=A0A364RBU3_9BACT|nr:3-dehydroquinate synthase [Pontibacter arcticus]RAU81810.1 3-dehydroquinate synthase [Pontibacter arcticus]